MAVSLPVIVLLSCVLLVMGTIATTDPKRHNHSSSKKNKDTFLYEFDIDEEKAHNPFPDICKGTPTPSQEEIRETNVCILRETWDRDLIVPLEKRFALRTQNGGMPISFASTREDRPPDRRAKRGAREDCNYGQRTKVRKFPGACRPSFFKKPFAYFTWTRMWNEIEGDFSYMYDYVLWDKRFPERKENQLWYLMLYLKTLASFVENPIDIFKVVRTNPGDASLVSRVVQLDKDLNIFVDNMRDALKSTARQTKYLNRT